MLRSWGRKCKGSQCRDSISYEGREGPGMVAILPRTWLGAGRGRHRVGVQSTCVCLQLILGPISGSLSAPSISQELQGHHCSSLGPAQDRVSGAGGGE